MSRYCTLTSKRPLPCCYGDEAERPSADTSRSAQSGLMFSPILPGDYYAPEGGMYFGLELATSSRLGQIHQGVLDLARKADSPTLGSVGGDFRPHLTLGVLRQGAEPTVPKTVDILRTFTCRPALGKLGQYGTFPQLLS